MLVEGGVANSRAKRGSFKVHRRRDLFLEPLLVIRRKITFKNEEFYAWVKRMPLDMPEKQTTQVIESKCLSYSESHSISRASEPAALYSPDSPEARGVPPARLSRLTRWSPNEPNSPDSPALVTRNTKSPVQTSVHAATALY